MIVSVFVLAGVVVDPGLTWGCSKKCCQANYLKKYLILPGERKIVHLKKFQLEVDNTAASIIFYGGGKIIYHEMEIPVESTRRQIWLINKENGYRVEFYNSKGSIVIFVNDFLINK